MSKSIVAATFAVGVLLLPLFGDEPPRQKGEKAKPDREAIRGAWLAKSGERNGEKFSAERLKNWGKLVFTADKVSREGSNPEEGGYTINPDKKPKEIDLFGDTWTGIYELKGTTLKLALRCGEERPTEFDPKHALVLVFEREKKAK
jgi:uncharacterized protein (TIGR03067 family)